MDSLRIEVEVLKSYMDRYHPSVGETYPALRQEAIDPEWVVTNAGPEGVPQCLPMDAGNLAGKDESRI